MTSTFRMRVRRSGGSVLQLTKPLDGTYWRIVLRNHGSLLLALGTLACGSASPRPDPDVEATLIHGGGLSGTSETIRIWSINGEAHGSAQLNNESRSRAVQLPRRTLESTLGVIESCCPPELGSSSDPRDLPNVAADGGNRVVRLNAMNVESGAAKLRR